jgi:phosphate transport system ATP-binding protein
MNIIEMKNLSVHYGKKTILKDINLNFKKGEIVSIIGPSGCGKTTLMHSINRMIEEDGGYFTGEILFKGENTRNVKVEELRKNIGIVFQQPTPFPLSIYENLAYPLRYYGIKKKEQIDIAVKKNLEKAGLYDEVADKLDSSPMELSGGQQQRLCIARSLTVDPEVLLLDEPCSALDIQNSHHIEKSLKELSKEYTIVMITHNLAQARRLSDRTVFISEGNIIEQSSTRELFENPKHNITKQYIAQMQA